MILRAMSRYRGILLKLIFGLGLYSIYETGGLCSKTRIHDSFPELQQMLVYDIQCLFTDIIKLRRVGLAASFRVLLSIC